MSNDDLVRRLREFDYREDIDALMMIAADALEAQAVRVIEAEENDKITAAFLETCTKQRDEAYARIAALEAQLAVFREALTPFAAKEIYCGGLDTDPDEEEVKWLFKIGHIRRARAVLAELSAPAQDDDAVWIVWFEDTDREPVIFSGEGATDAAYAYFNQCQHAWTSHLFKRVLTDGSRAPDAPAQQTPDIDAMQEAMKEAEEALSFYHDTWTSDVPEERKPDIQLLEDAGFNAGLALQKLRGAMK